MPTSLTQLPDDVLYLILSSLSFPTTAGTPPPPPSASLAAVLALRACSQRAHRVVHHWPGWRVHLRPLLLAAAARRGSISFLEDEVARERALSLPRPLVLDGVLHGTVGIAVADAAACASAAAMCEYALREADVALDVAYRGHRIVKWACAAGALPLLRMLCQDERVAAAVGEIGETMYGYAAGHGRAAVVDFLLATPSVGGRVDGLLAAAGSGHEDIFERLLVAGVDPAVQEGEALSRAAAAGQLRMVQRLLELPGLHAAMRNHAALSRATRAGHADVVELLLDSLEHDPDLSVLLPLLEVSCWNDMPTVLVRFVAVLRRATDRRWVQVALMAAAENGAVQCMRWLLAQDDVDAGLASDVALRSAATEGHAEVVALLLAQPSVNCNARNGFPLMAACAHEHVDVARLLIEHGADVSLSDQLALRTAAANGRTDIVALLLAADGCDPSACAGEALRHACKGGHVHVTRLLLASGRVWDEEALRLAASAGHADVVQLVMQDRRTTRAAIAAALSAAARAGHANLLRLMLADSRGIDVASLDVESGDAATIDALLAAVL